MVWADSHEACGRPEFMPNLSSLDDLRIALRQFAKERDWEQFHTPKNLAMALVVEAAELLENFQWLTPEESQHLDQNQLLIASKKTRTEPTIM